MGAGCGCGGQLTGLNGPVILSDWRKMALADVAQLVEQLICNQQVKGSSPFVSSSALRDGVPAHLTTSALGGVVCCTAERGGQWWGARAVKGSRL